VAVEDVVRVVEHATEVLARGRDAQLEENAVQM